MADAVRTKSTRRRRLSIISLPNEAAEGRGAEEKDIQGREPEPGKGGKDVRRRRLSIVGLYTGEVIQQSAEEVVAAPDEGDGADEPGALCDTVKEYGYASTAGYEPTGHKKTNQDAFYVESDFAGRRYEYVFGVFDGHGRVGHKSSNYVAQQYAGSFAAKLKACANVASAFKACFVEIDRNMGSQDFDIKMSGTTATCVYIKGDHLYTAQVGDSRAILATQTAQGLQAVELTFDQKPELPDEKKRIEAANGIVEPIDDPHEGPVGPSRVWVKRQAIPGLAMSRSLGDALAGSVGVCPDPVVNSFKVEPFDKFIIVASDGVWEFITNDEAVAIVAQFSDPQKACDNLCAEAFSRWKEEEHVVDDITAIVIHLRPPV